MTNSLPSEETTAHTVRRTLVEVAYYPAHGPRSKDPNYRIFHASRRHLIDVLGVGCWIGGATKAEIAAGLPVSHLCYGRGAIMARSWPDARAPRGGRPEAHHEVAEFAGLNEIDWRKVAADFPTAGITSDEDFLRFAESEGGLTILCSKHHRHPRHGIHAVTYPVWKLDRYARRGWEFLDAG